MENKYTYPSYFLAYENVEFTLLLTHPPYHKLQCILTKCKIGHFYITCQIDHLIHSFIFIEQQVIRKGFMEVFTFTNFYGRQTLVRPIEKPIFRQVNKF